MNKIINILKKHRLLITTVLLLIAVFWFFFWPLNSVVESPGKSVNIQPMVKIKGKTPLKKTHFMLTAVELSQAHPYSYVVAKFDPHISVEDTNSVTAGQNNEQFNKVQNIYMNNAINNASAVGYHKANQQVKQKYHGVYILNILPNSDFKNKLQPSDLIESVNGKRLNQSTEYIKYIQSLPKNAKLNIQYKRNGKNGNYEGHKRQIVKGFNGIGITMIDDMTLKTSPEVKINPGEIGGPSGGLMFALQVYSQLKNKNYKYDKIAGTGTINANGYVGEIGGIDKKIIAANKSGAQVFFCPYVKPTKLNLMMEDGHKTNYQVAKATVKKYAPHMKLVPVSTFDDAINYLER